MADAPDDRKTAKPPASAREARLAKALKANLRRRKAAAPPPEKED